MLLKQYDLGYLAHASYLIADEAMGTAVVVDPQRDIAPYLHDTMPHGWHIDSGFLTHFHTDFLASHDVRGSGEHAGTAIAASLHLPPQSTEAAVQRRAPRSYRAAGHADTADGLPLVSLGMPVDASGCTSPSRSGTPGSGAAGCLALVVATQEELRLREGGGSSLNSYRRKLCQRMSTHMPATPAPR